MISRIIHIAITGLLAFLAASCVQNPAGPLDAPAKVEFVLEDSGTIPPELAALLEKAGVKPLSTLRGGAGHSLQKSGSIQAINEARVLVLDCSKWSTELGLLLALGSEPDSLYDPGLLDPRKDVWDNLLAIFRGYKGKTYQFAGEYALFVQGGFARGVVSVHPGLNIFFAVLREAKKTVYVYSTLARIPPSENVIISLSPASIVKTLLSNIAVYDSSGWSPLGSGVNGEVRSVASSGNLVYVGGSFSRAGPIAASNIAVWDEQTLSWSALGSGLSGPVTDIEIVGPDVYVTGAFTNAGAVTVNNVARWNGSTWSALGSGVNAPANAVTVFGTSIIAGGEFSSASGTAVNSIAEWNGASWAAMNAGTNGTVFSLLSTGASVVVGGNFGRVGPLVGGVQTNSVALWDGVWTSLSTGTNTLGSVHALELDGNLVFAGGLFSSIGGTPANNIAVWTGSAWQSLGGGVNGRVQAIAFDAADSSLYAGGLFINTASGADLSSSFILRYKSGTWFPMGAGLDGPVNALLVNGRRLYVGGAFRYNN